MLAPGPSGRPTGAGAALTAPSAAYFFRMGTGDLVGWAR
jgi:hypothetical protein